jgi:hypothetical protein
MGSRSILAISLAVAALVAGCGSLGGLPGRVDAPHVVTAKEIDSYPKDSPVRTVLSWWRALQFSSPELARRYYAPDVRPTRAQMALFLKLGPNILNLRAAVDVQGVERHGDRATVLALLTRSLRHPNGRTDRIRTPASFDLVEQQGEWLLADNQYLDGILDAVKRFAKEAPSSVNKTLPNVGK